MNEKASRPIGVFDSGLGGLTVVKMLLQRLPHENIIYFGDTARVPYGDRSKQTIIQYAKDDIDFLLTHDVKAICIACNTADSMAKAEMEQRYRIPIIGVVEPAAKMAAATSQNRKIGVIGTKATIKSGAYAAVIAREAPDAEVISVPCPLLCPLVEEGRFLPGDAVVESVLRDYLAPIKAAGADTLILGCTHYPLLMPKIKKYLPAGVRVISQGEYVAKSLQDYLERHPQLEQRCAKHGEAHYLTTENPEKFKEQAQIFLNDDILVENITLG